MNFHKITAFLCLAVVAISMVEDIKIEQTRKNWDKRTGLQMQEMRRWEDEEDTIRFTNNKGIIDNEESIAYTELQDNQHYSSHLRIHQPSSILGPNINTHGQTYSRSLQSNSTTSNLFISGATSVFQCLFSVLRNLIIVGLLTNSLDIFLPYLILSESFLMLGFWASEKHYLFNLFSNVFSSRFDAINAFRLIIQPSSNSSNLSQLSQYGFSSIAAVNLSGEILIAFLLLAFTILAKIGGVCAKYECLRRVSVQLRSKWNGYFFAIFPRVVTLTGLHWRGLGLGTAMDALNGLTCTFLMLLMVFYLVMLIIQTRRIAFRTSTVEYSRKQIGLVGRIDYKRQFNFDCLKFSSLHYPSMNSLRLIVYFLPIGILWDCQQLSFGGPIAGQFFMIMIEISSSGYFKLRDKIMFPLQNFALLLIQLCLLVVGLAESAFYSPISEQFEIVLYCLLTLLIGSSIVATASDAWQEIHQRCNNKIMQAEESDCDRKENDTTQHFVQSKTKKTVISQENQERGEEENNKVEKYVSSFRKTTTQLTNIKIKKVKAGNKPQTSLFFA